jgi:hypothetical protein
LTQTFPNAKTFVELAKKLAEEALRKHFDLQVQSLQGRILTNLVEMSKKGGEADLSPNRSKDLAFVAYNYLLNDTSYTFLRTSALL